MPAIEISSDTYAKLSAIATWEGISIGEVVTRLLNRKPEPRGRGDGRVSVHAVYRQVRVEGTYDPGTQTVTIDSSPWEGEEFSKPSTAAIAVVTRYNPERNANTNGWRFWRVSDTGRLLDSLRET
ncbi:hypothetical protein [Allosalinactinospora lopnorensis]|uniref:hypothetical protein n=1 Tax=Allosalinactinospora lopnorensis TaxID=1352348 RepID=UPI000697604D|nr:hypothetical protein [Allosalinactinospora lopnorensis]